MQSHLRKVEEDKREEGLCKDAWRKSKYDTAQQLAALQLEHHASRVVEKEQLRLDALKERENRFNNQSERKRKEHEERSTSVATTLVEQQRLREKIENDRDGAEAARAKAFEDSLQMHRQGLSMRGKEKKIDIHRKQTKVREMEHEKVRHYMHNGERKMSQFVHNQVEKQRREEEVQAMKELEARRHAEKRLHVQTQAEQRKEELLKKLAEQDEMSRRATERKAEEDQLRQEAHLLRQAEIEKAKSRLRKMEKFKLDDMAAKVEANDERIRQMQEERIREMKMVRRIKQDSLLKQHEIKDKALRKKQRKERNRSSCSAPTGNQGEHIDSMSRNTQGGQSAGQQKSPLSNVSSEDSEPNKIDGEPDQQGEELQEAYGDDFDNDEEEVAGDCEGYGLNKQDVEMEESPNNVPESPDEEYGDDDFPSDNEQ